MSKKDMTASERRYNDNLTALREHMYQKELARREWAKEKWLNVNGIWFKLDRVLIILFSLYTVVSVIIYCLIRNAQQLMNEVVSGMPKLSYEADIRYVTPYIIAALVACAVLFAGNVQLIRRRYKSGALLCAASTLYILLHILTQLFIPMPKESIYQLFFSVSCVFYALLLVCVMYVILTLYTERRNARAAADYQLTRFASTAGSMPDIDSYSDMIEQYLQKQQAADEPRE